jgi:hypothetical protein
MIKSLNIEVNGVLYHVRVEEKDINSLPAYAQIDLLLDKKNHFQIPLKTKKIELTTKAKLVEELELSAFSYHSLEDAIKQLEKEIVKFDKEPFEKVVTDAILKERPEYKQYSDKIYDLVKLMKEGGYLK